FLKPGLERAAAHDEGANPAWPVGENKDHVDRPDHATAIVVAARASREWVSMVKGFATSGSPERETWWQNDILGFNPDSETCTGITFDLNFAFLLSRAAGQWENPQEFNFKTLVKRMFTYPMLTQALVDLGVNAYRGQLGALSAKLGSVSGPEAE